MSWRRRALHNTTHKIHGYILLYLSLTVHKYFIVDLCYLFSTSPRRPFYQHGIISTPAWISNYIKYWIYYILKSVRWNYISILKLALLKFGNGWVILSRILQDVWLLFHAGIKVNLCGGKMGLHGGCLIDSASLLGPVPMEEPWKIWDTA